MQPPEAQGALRPGGAWQSRKQELGKPVGSPQHFPSHLGNQLGVPLAPPSPMGTYSHHLVGFLGVHTGGNPGPSVFMVLSWHPG